MLKTFVVPGRDIRIRLLRRSEIALDIISRYLLIVLLGMSASRLTRFFEFRSTHLLLVLDSLRKCAANTSNVLFLLAAFVRSQVLKTSEPCCFILVFFACVSEHLRLSSAALHLCVNLQLLLFIH